MVVMEVPQFMGEDAAHFVHGKLRKEPSKDDDMMVAKSVGIELRRVFDIERKVTAPKACFLEHWVKAGFNVGKVIAFGFVRAVYMEQEGLEKGKSAQERGYNEDEGKDQADIFARKPAAGTQGLEPGGRGEKKHGRNDEG